jgi:hypothetical protein
VTRLICLRIKPCGLFLFQFRITSEIMNHRYMVGLLGRVISSNLHRTTQHRKTRTNIHALSGIRSRDPVYERGHWIGTKLNCYSQKTTTSYEAPVTYLTVVIHNMKHCIQDTINSMLGGHSLLYRELTN